MEGGLAMVGPLGDQQFSYTMATLTTVTLNFYIGYIWSNVHLLVGITPPANWYHNGLIIGYVNCDVH